MKSKKTGKKIEKAKADVRYIVVNNNRLLSHGDDNAQVFETLDDAKEFYEDGLRDEDFEPDVVEGLEVMEVKVVKTHHLYVDTLYEVTASNGGD